MRTLFKLICTMLCATVLTTSASCAENHTNSETADTAAVITVSNPAETTESAAETTSQAQETTTVKTTTSAMSSIKTESAATTVTKAAETESEPAVSEVQDKLKYHKYYSKGIDGSTTIHLSGSSDLFDVTDMTTWYFFDFADMNSIGRTHDDKICYGSGYTCCMRATIIDDRTLTVKACRTMVKGITCTDIKMEYEVASEKLVYDVTEDDKHADIKLLTADLYDACYKNGLYRITAYYDNGMTDTLYLFVNCASNDPSDYEFYTCYGEEHYIAEGFDPMERNAKINAFIESEGITPENALTASRHYPEAAPRDNDDSQYWIDLSHELIRGYENYSTAYKATILHDWITSHLKYDYYKVEVLHLQRYYKQSGSGRILDTSQYVSKNYTGVCLDFSCIYAIMCREAGIPCVVLNDDTHAWNAIYLKSSDRWYEVDLTVDVNRGVTGEDTNVVSGDKLYDYSGFLSFDANDHTPEHATWFCWE